MTPVVVPPVAAPAVTIVIVTYGQWALCRKALESVVEHTEPVYEVVLVDNASPDGTAERLRREVVGATLVFNEVNRGFGPGANQGALHAVGRHLCFLNSDAFVTAGWLPPLLDVLDRYDDVAAVSPRFLNMDGTLQEAGSLVDCGAVTLAYGYGDDPERLDYRFSRTLDYGSGACLLIRRRDFSAVGGFDPVYGRGYYEDADLGLALAARNRRVVYEPRSSVRHVRAGSAVLDEAAMALVAINRATFRERWSKQIASRPTLEFLDRQPHHLVAGRDFGCLDRFLVLGRGSGRSEVLAQRLAHLWPAARVTLLQEGPLPVGRASELLAAGVEVVPVDDDRERWLEARRFHYSVVLSGVDDHRRLEAVLVRTQPQAKRVLDLGVDAHTAPGEADERAAVRAADAVLCTTEQELRSVAGSSPGTPAFVLSAVAHVDERDMTMLEVMSHLGTAPPLSALERRTVRL